MMNKSAKAFRPSGGATLPPDRDIMENLGSALLTIDKPPIHKIGDNLHPENVLCIGSYNWTEERTPTIIVPGSPAHWRNRPVPFTVAPDSGFSYANQNNYRMPGAGLVPLVVAVQTVTPDFDWSSVDIVTDRNNLRKLIRWITFGTELGKSKDQGIKDFRINLELAGNETLLMERWAEKDREGQKYTTYGFNFERESTTTVPGCEGATAHHRIICYDFDDLRVVVRFEVDACLAVPQRSAKKEPPPSSSSGVDDLESALSGLSLSSRAQTSAQGAPTQSTAGVTVRRGATLVAQSELVEMTTRKAPPPGRRAWPFDWHEAYPQLYLSQTPNHFLARYENGRFFEIKQCRLNESPETKQADRELQPAFRALKAILSEVKQIVMDRGSGVRSSLVCKNGEMTFYTREEKGCLPDELMKIFTPGTEKGESPP